MEQKKIGRGKADAARTDEHGLVETMKPFVTFGVKALAVLGSALVHIVKNIPKPDDRRPANKNDKVIKI